MADSEQVDRPIWEWPPEGNGDPTHTDALSETLDIDVVVAGGGITGLTAALLLASDKRRVALLEARHLGAGTTGSTSAHVSAVPDDGYQAVLRTAGAEGGKEYVSRCAAALEFMQHLVEAEHVDCEWARVPAYQFCERDDDLDFLRAEQEAAAQLGQMSQLVSDVPLPWHVAGALEFPQQALFQPLAYLAGLKRIAVERGVAIHEHTPVLGWEETRGGVVVQTPHASARAAALVLATHTPLGINPVQAELTPMQSYILAVSSSQPFPQALFWDLDDPYHYLRPVQFGGRSLVLVGGADQRPAGTFPTAMPISSPMRTIASPDRPSSGGGRRNSSSRRTACRTSAEHRAPSACTWPAVSRESVSCRARWRRWSSPRWCAARRARTCRGARRA